MNEKIALSEHPSSFKAHILIQQIEDESHGHSHWMLMALKLLLVERPYMTVEQLVNEVEILCPKAMVSVNDRMREHGYI